MNGSAHQCSQTKDVWSERTRIINEQSWYICPNDLPCENEMAAVLWCPHDLPYKNEWAAALWCSPPWPALWKKEYAVAYWDMFQCPAPINWWSRMDTCVISCIPLTCSIKQSGQMLTLFSGWIFHESLSNNSWNPCATSFFFTSSTATHTHNQVKVSKIGIYIIIWAEVNHSKIYIYINTLFFYNSAKLQWSQNCIQKHREDLMFYKMLCV